MAEEIKFVILSLGDFFTIDIEKIKHSFANLIKTKKHITQEVANNFMNNILRTKFKTIMEFNLGIPEDDFKQEMLEAFKEIADTDLSTEEFEECWSAMYTVPDFESLAIAINNNKNKNPQIIIVSDTNPIDMRHNTEQLKNNHIQIDTESNVKLNKTILKKIAGMRVELSYAHQKSKKDLILDLLQSTKHSAFSSLFKFPNGKAVYVRCPNKIEDPLLKDRLDENNDAIEKFVETVIWDKGAGVKLDSLLTDIVNGNINTRYTKLTA